MCRLCSTIENLESRCEELTKQIDELNQIITIERRKKERLVQENKALTETTNSDATRKDRAQLRPVPHQNGEPYSTQSLANGSTNDMVVAIHPLMVD